MGEALGLYLFGLIAVLLSEYGFQSRKRTLSGFRARRRWRRSFYRLLMWGVLVASNGWPVYFALLASALALFLVGELAVLLFRARLRREMAAARPFGGTVTHLLPHLFMFALPAVAFAGHALIPGAALPNLPSTRLLMLGLAVISLWSWATMLTVSVVQIVRPEQLKEEISPTFGTGELIGLLERYITFMLVVAGGLVPVGFVIAVKAAVRFPMFEDRQFAEYFLIGTLCSVGLAVLAGLAFSAI